MKHNLKTAFFLFLLIVLPSSPAWAHKAYIFAWLDGNTVHTKSKLSGGKPVNQGKVLVYSQKGEQLREGLTNAKGEFSFPLNPLRPLKIVLNAGEGHRGEWMLQIEETDEESLPQTEKAAVSHSPTEKAAPVSCAEQVLTNSVLDQKLEPIYRDLAELKEDKPTIQDILGGIGYIIGLVGLAAYFKSRKP